MLSSIVMVTGFTCCTICVALFGLYIYSKLTIGMCTNKNSLHGKTVLITGGNSGIGFEAAKEFARRGARLLLACRNEEKAREAICNIQQETSNEDIQLYKLDTSSLQSVEHLAHELLSCKRIQIDVLCLNAGCLPDKERRKSVDGFEYGFAANHLGHFHLVNLIQSILSPSARVIITSSMIHEFVRLDFTDLQLEKNYSRFLSYSRSKLMNIYHMRELAKRLNPLGITVNAIHPGLVHNLFLQASDFIEHLFTRVILPIYGKSSWQGAQTIIHLATSNKLEGVTGRYFTDCKVKSLNENANDRKAPKKLWEYSEKIISIWKQKQNNLSEN